MWTSTTHRHHSRRTARYASDLTDTECRLMDVFGLLKAIGNTLAAKPLLDKAGVEPTTALRP